ncbi:hypothetical protein GCM10027190_24550 [Spirosoma areae]
MSVFTKNAGRILDSRETKALKAAHRAAKLACGLSEDEYIRSEFFGLNQVMHLLRQPDCVGLRVHYGKRWEDDNGKPTKPGKGQLKPRILLTGVDATGKDMPIFDDIAGTKDMPESGGDRSLGDGHTCPRHCA